MRLFFIMKTSSVLLLFYPDQPDLIIRPAIVQVLRKIWLMKGVT